MRLHYHCLLLCLFPIITNAQRMLFFESDHALQSTVEKGDSAFFAGAYPLAVSSYDMVLAKEYSKEAAINQLQNLHAAGNTGGLQQLLRRMADSGFFEVWALPALDSLQQQPSLAPIIARMRANQQAFVEKQSLKYPALVMPILQMEYWDQRHQWVISFKSRYANAYTGISPAAAEQQKDIAFRENVDSIKKLVKKYGYLWKGEVGERATAALWLMTQHADFDTAFQQAFLDAMGPAVAKGMASGNNLAYLTDRVRKNKGEKQVYGTQMSYRLVTDAAGKQQAKTEVYPVEDPEHLDERRKSVGLMPMAAYLQLMRQLNNHD